VKPIQRNDINQKGDFKMENTGKLNPDFETLARTAFFIEKIHRCADCPIRRLAIKRPQSIFARIHNWHKTWWPAWKIHQTGECPFAARAGTHA
jgi:hypothetical protein